MFEADVLGDNALLYTEISAVFQGQDECDVTTFLRFCQMTFSIFNLT